MTACLGWLRLLLSGAIGALALCAGPWIGLSSADSNSLHGGATSIQFLTLGGGGRAPSLRTSGVFLKCHFSDRGALRVGADFSLDESSGRSPNSIDLENHRSYFVSVGAELEEYVDATGPVTIFLGVGPYWTRGRSFFEVTRTYDDYYLPSAISYYKSERRYWEVGGSAAVGFEWFFRRKLSLIGRVGASVGFGKRHEIFQQLLIDPNYPRSDEDLLDSTTAQAGASGAMLGLGIYF